MTDITDAHAPNLSFAEASRKAEEEALAAQDSEQAPGEPAPAAAAPPAPADADAEADRAAAEQAAAETPAERLLAGKYKSVEELERAYAAQQQLVDRQGNEIGDLRRAYDDRFAEIERRQAEPAPTRISVTPDLIEQNPAYAVQVAYEQKDPATLAVAFETWRAVDESAAQSWLVQASAVEREQQLRAETDAKIAALEARIGPLAAATETDELRRGIEAMPTEARAFLADQQAVEQLANEFPSIGAVIVSGTPGQRLEAVKALYEIQRGRTADTLASSTTEVARQTALEAQQARDDAHVASVSAASQEEPKTREQIEQEAMTAAFTRKRGIWADAFVKSPNTQAAQRLAALEAREKLR